MWLCQGKGLVIAGVGVGGEAEDTGDIHHSWSLILDPVHQSQYILPSPRPVSII